MSGLTISNNKGKRTATFWQSFNYDDFMSLYQDIKRECDHLKLISSVEKIKEKDGKMTYTFYYNDPNNQVKLRIYDFFYFVDFNDFITLTGQIKEFEYNKLFNENLKAFEINITCQNQISIYEIVIIVDRLYVMEGISKIKQKH